MSVNFYENTVTSLEIIVLSLFETIIKNQQNENV